MNNRNNNNNNFVRGSSLPQFSRNISNNENFELNANQTSTSFFSRFLCFSPSKLFYSCGNQLQNVYNKVPSISEAYSNMTSTNINHLDTTLKSLDNTRQDLIKQAEEIQNKISIKLSEYKKNPNTVKGKAYGKEAVILNKRLIPLNIKIDNLASQIQKLQTMKQHIDSNESNIDFARSMKTANNILKKTMIDTDNLEDIMMDSEDMVSQCNDINKIINQTITEPENNIDERDLENELKLLNQEYGVSQVQTIQIPKNKIKKTNIDNHDDILMNNTKQSVLYELYDPNISDSQLLGQLGSTSLINNNNNNINNINNNNNYEEKKKKMLYAN